MTLTEGVLAKAGESFIKDVYGAVKDSAVKKWQSFNWYTSEGSYYQKIEKDYGATRILGKPQPVPLEGIYIDVHILSKPAALHRFDIAQIQQNPDIIEARHERLSGLDLVKSGKFQRLYILGKPGAGKTTFLKYIAVKAAQQEISKVPIFVSLKEWADSETSLLEFLVKQFDTCHFPDARPLIEYILEMGLAIVLFDGLDETRQDLGVREKIIKDIRNFSRKYDKSQILMTCRIAASDYIFDDFIYLEIADFSEQQVEDYISRWFENNESILTRFKKEFNRSENERLREIASIPLLLSLLCLDFEERKNFPNRSVDIYEIGLDALLKNWDKSRDIKRDQFYKDLSLERKKDMFAYISRHTFSKTKYFFEKKLLCDLIADYLVALPNADEKKDIDSEGVLDAIVAHHGILVERAYEIYSFSHLTFQEYYYAHSIVEDEDENSFRDLLDANIITNNQWHEVILNVAGLLKDGDSFIKIMQDSVSRIVADDSTLTDFLSWADMKTDKLSIGNRAMARFFYIYLALILDYSRDIADMRKTVYGANTGLSHARTGNFDQKLDFYHVVYHNTASDLAYALNRAFVLERDADLARAIDFLLKMALILDKDVADNLANKRTPQEVLDFTLALECASKIEPDLAADFKLIIAYLAAFFFAYEKKASVSVLEQKSFIGYWQELKDAPDINRTINYHELLKIDKFLKSPNYPKRWSEFAEQLRVMLRTYRNFKNKWHFSKGQIEILRNYFRANRLALKCIAAARLSNSQEMEDSLLLPPTLDRT